MERDAKRVSGVLLSKQQRFVVLPPCPKAGRQTLGSKKVLQVFIAIDPRCPADICPRWLVAVVVDILQEFNQFLVIEDVR